MRGRKPKPTELLKAHGSWRAKIRDDEPAMEVCGDVPIAPNNLTGEALACWVKTASELVAVRVLSKSDLNALERYCRFWALFKDATDPDLMMKLDQRLIKIEEQFGLTPSARARVKASKPATAKDTKAAKYFNNAAGLKVAK